jgi:7-carboxy-7-deazaguanine synthase
MTRLHIQGMDLRGLGVNEVTRYNQPKDKVPVIEIFGPTIQGEGIMAGSKTMFIRFGGCDFRCAKCDSLHAVIPQAVKQNAYWLSPSDIMAQLRELDSNDDGGVETPWVTLSGGNPAMWELSNVVTALHEAGYKVAVETQGSIWRTWLAEVDMLTVCPKGPGMGEAFNRQQFEAFLDEIMHAYRRMIGALSICIKAVVFDQRDFEFVADLDKLLSQRGYNFPERYISLGNDIPPQLNLETFQLEPSEKENALEDEEALSLSDYLLGNMTVLLEDYFKDPRLANWKFLPQLHVLLYGNKTGV